MISVSCLEGVFCYAYICLIPVLCCHCGLVDNASFKALVLQRAVLFVPAVALFFFFLRGGFCFLFLGFFFVGQVQVGFEIGHARVGQFYGVFVEYFVELVVGWE